MIRLTATINIPLSREVVIDAEPLEGSGNNISSSLDNIENARVIAKNPFILGSSALGEPTILTESVDYFISKATSDKNKEFSPYIKIHISVSSSVWGFSIAFDTINNVYPTKMIINGREYTNDSPVFDYDGVHSNSFTIYITELNQAYKPLTITGIYTVEHLAVNQYNLKSLNSKFMNKAELSVPSWGIFSNICSMELIDENGRILNYANNNQLVENLLCDMYIENYDEKNKVSIKREHIATVYTADWSYDSENKTVNVTFKDNLEKLQNQTMSTEYIGEGKTMYDLYQFLLSKTPNKYAKLFVIDDETKVFLENSKCFYAYFEEGSLWSQWEKLCETCLLQMSYNQKGEIILRHRV
jgi:hypothetical protein